MDALRLLTLLRQDPTVRVLDVRTPGEFGDAHIEGSYNVPLDLLGEHASELRSTRARTVVLVCQSGQRARRAEAVLHGAGMPNLHVLEGGMNEWLATGLDAARPRRRMSLERQVRIAAGALVTAGAIAALTVSPLWALLPAAVGSGLMFSGLTDTCGMGMLLAKLPYNRSAASCDTETIVRQFLAGDSGSR